MQLGVVHNSLVLSQTAWKALPDEYKKILEEARPQAYRLQREAYEEADKKAGGRDREEGSARQGSARAGAVARQEGDELTS